MGQGPEQQPQHGAINRPELPPPRQQEADLYLVSDSFNELLNTIGSGQFLQQWAQLPYAQRVRVEQNLNILSRWMRRLNAHFEDAVADQEDKDTIKENPWAIEFDEDEFNERLRRSGEATDDASYLRDKRDSRTLLSIRKDLWEDRRFVDRNNRETAEQVNQSESINRQMK